MKLHRFISFIEASLSSVSALIVLAIFGTCFDCHAQTADEVLKKCQYLESQTSYSAELENLTKNMDLGHGIKLVMQQKIWGKQNGDGTQQSRVETTGSIQGSSSALMGRKPPLIPSTVIITTVTGEMWKLDAADKEASQMTFIKDTLKSLKTAVQKNAAQNDSTLLEGSKNELSEETLDGQPCFKLILTFSQEAIQKQLDMWKSPAFEALKQTAARPVIAKKELWVRKSDYLVIQTCMYDQDGNRLSGVKYNNIIIGLPLPADFFEIPKDYKKIALNSLKELAANFLSKVVDPNTGIRASDSKSTGYKTTRTVFLIILLMLTVVPVSILIIWFAKPKRKT